MENTSDTTKSDPHNDDDASLKLADSLKQIKLNLTPAESRFFGDSSGAMLVRTAMELKNEYTGGQSGFEGAVKPGVKHKRQYFWIVQPVRGPFCISLPLFTFF